MKLEGSDGKPYVISYLGLWQVLKEQMNFEEKLGWNKVTKSLREDVTKLRDSMLAEILIPKAKIAILEFLKENPNVGTGSFHHQAWLSGERSNAWYYAKQELEAEGKIIATSHGSGKDRTWNIKES